jgi:hypothetical protein
MDSRFRGNDGSLGRKILSPPTGRRCEHAMKPITPLQCGVRVHGAAPDDRNAVDAPRHGVPIFEKTKFRGSEPWTSSFKG